MIKHVVHSTGRSGGAARGAVANSAAAEGVKPSTRSPGEQAFQFFIRGVQRIPGVLDVRPSGDPQRGWTVIVAVPTLRSEVSDAVFELEAEMLRRFSGAPVDVRVKGLKERGIDPANVKSALLY